MLGLNWSKWVNPNQLWNIWVFVHLFKDFQYKFTTNSVNIWPRKVLSFFQKKVRILPEIDWLCYQWATLAKMGIVPAKLVLRGDVSGARRCYVLAHTPSFKKGVILFWLFGPHPKFFYVGNTMRKTYLWKIEKVMELGGLFFKFCFMLLFVLKNSS